jgi:hypothetical protein
VSPFSLLSLRLGSRCSALPNKPRLSVRAHHQGKAHASRTIPGFRVPPHSPSDIVSPASTLWWARVRVWPCRKIHLYGESKKSTHDHQTHLPARTHHSDLVKIRPTTARSSPDSAASVVTALEPQGAGALWLPQLGRDLGAERWKPALSPLDPTKLG